jgi:hypothetical protein
MDMNYGEAKRVKAGLEAKVAALSEALQSFPRGGALGLTSDTVKATPAFQGTSSAYKAAFEALRRFNAKYVTTFAKEIRAERAARRQVAA